jgi:plastocyanin
LRIARIQSRSQLAIRSPGRTRTRCRTRRPARSRSVAVGDDLAGSSFSQVFSEAGEFGYFCEFHPNMTGTIVVQ